MRAIRKKPVKAKNTHAGGWRTSLGGVLRKHNKSSAKGGKASSFATQAKRAEILESGIKQLQSMGYGIKNVYRFRETHMRALVKAWEKAELAPATIQNKISIFRVFAEWIGKSGAIRDSRLYVSSPEKVQRHTYAETDKTWSGQNIDADVLMEKVASIDERVAIQLQLQQAFGLRMKEAALLHPHGADRGSQLAINWGTKGGRDRIVDIKTPEQRAILDKAKELVKKPTDSLVPKDIQYVQWRNHYYYVCRQVGISRKGGITSHGLRHEQANAQYEKITGEKSPIKGGNPSKINPELHELAMQEIAEQLGHSRPDVSTAYLGSFGKNSPLKKQKK